MDLVTLMIPTKNRSQWVERMLNYYSDIGFKHNIYLLDSSDKEFQVLNSKVVKSFSTNLQISYYHLPNTASGDATGSKIQKINSKYIIVTGDDDYLVPRTLMKCISFLEGNPDYNSAGGKVFSPYVKISQFKTEIS